MLASFLLSLREGLEAALIVGIVLGVLNKVQRRDLSAPVWLGAASAAGLALISALALNWLGMELSGRAEQIFEGVVLLFAAGVLTWMIFWMRRTSLNLKSEIEAKTQQALRGGGLFALAFLSVFREGIELALFLLAVRQTVSPLQTIAGAALGLFAAVTLGLVLFSSTRRLNLRLFFNVTNLLLIIFAAGMVGLGIHELNEAGIIPAVTEHLWNLNGVLDEKSELGLLLKALFGYNGNPSLTEVLGYLSYLGGIFTFLTFSRAKASAPSAQAAG
ncbi:MAG: FTR1 family protein [Anaerolineales bacterium]